MSTFLKIATIILSAIIIILVLLQPSKSEGFGGELLTGKSNRFFSKNKSHTYEAMLSRLTVFTSILFAIVVLILNVNS